MPKRRLVTRRSFLKRAAAATVAAPLVVNSKVFGANGRINLGVVGTGGRGRSDMGGAMGFQEIRVVAVCDVDRNHANTAKRAVDGRYGNSDCKTTVDFREITRRQDVDALLIGTPDHWHAIISIDAMKHGKDVFCEKPETLTVRQGKEMRKIARRYGRVFSGGSQRVWGDYNWFHKMVRGGAIGEPKEAWVNVKGPSGPCGLPAEQTPAHLDWDRWLGPAPYRPFNRKLHPFHWRWYRDYSGGNMTDWGCHGFGGALFALNLHETGPVEVHPPGGEYQRLTYIFKNGVRVYHNGGWGKPQLSFKGTEGEAPERNGHKARPPEVHIPNYKGRGGIFGDFVHCVKTREKPFRDIAIAHRTASHCHIGNIAYWLKRSLKWDPEKEEFIGDDEANRWLDRPMRAPWSL
ncbi:MAG: Gfo/Idh/MocA family protein [Planctomycetota bacterium]|jgi:predicted dehydrogenase